MSGLNAGAATFVPRTSQQQPLGGSATPSHDAAEQGTLLGDDGAADVLQYLSGIYPQYSVAALRDIFISHDGDLYGTLEMLAELEREFQSSVVDNQKKVPTTKQRSLQIDDAAFPTLGSAGTRQDFEPLSRTWASLAAAPRSTTADVTSARQAKPHTWDGTKLSAQSKTTPIWSSGVEKFETGTAIAAEYATRRAEASDLARLRNQYFVQVGRIILFANVISLSVGSDIIIVIVFVVRPGVDVLQSTGGLLSAVQHFPHCISHRFPIQNS